MANGTIRRVKNEIKIYGQVTIGANRSDYYEVENGNSNYLAVIPYQSGYSDSSQLKLCLGVIKVSNSWLITVYNPSSTAVTFNLYYIVIPC